MFATFAILNVTITSRRGNGFFFVAKNIEDKLNELKSNLNKQQNTFQSLSKVKKTAVKASYAFSHLITFNSKPFTDRQFIN
jgi:hypothetical protein